MLQVQTETAALLYYNGLQKQFAPALLLMRVGNLYVAFGKTAQTLAKATGNETEAFAPDTSDPRLPPALLKDTVIARFDLDEIEAVMHEMIDAGHSFAIAEGVRNDKA